MFGINASLMWETGGKHVKSRPRKVVPSSGDDEVRAAYGFGGAGVSLLISTVFLIFGVAAVVVGS